MSEKFIVEIFSNAIIVAIKIASPALLSILIMGLLVSIFQAATQINEQTLSFIPKILAMTVSLILAGAWIIQTIVFFTREIIEKIPGLID